MESIQQALYEAESFFAFICPMKAKHLVRPSHLEAVEEVLDQIEA